MLYSPHLNILHNTNKSNRHIGLNLLNINIYSFSLFLTSILLIGALPILGIAITGLLLDRNLHSNLYNHLGDPVLYQHLFWFFGHPEVYVIILPIFGLTSLILTGIVHKDLFGREGMMYCIIRSVKQSQSMLIIIFLCYLSI